MQVSYSREHLLQADAEAVVVGIYANVTPSGPTGAADELSGGIVSRLVGGQEIRGKPNEITTIWSPAGPGGPHVVVVGLGDRSQVDQGVVFRAASAAARHLASKQRGRVAFHLDDDWPADWTVAGVAGAIVGCHGQDLYRAEKKRFQFHELVWAGGDEPAFARGQILGESVNMTRRLVNESPQDMYPESFAAAAARLAHETGLELEIWDETRLAEERCGALLAVARGSDRPPRLVIARHQGAEADAPWLALVGKGVTFDSGGLSLKPSDSMLTMKCDMAGAATVLGAMRAIRLLKLEANVMGLVGLVENMPSGKAMKLGDVLRARNGRSIEVHNTDAEGRLVLADVLAVAVDRGAAKIVDLATLTGACMVALGTDVAGTMTNDQSWCDAWLSAARDCGEPVWQLPMYSEYGEQIRGEVADIKNVGEGRWGGAITAAKFLEEFVADKPWVHVDIAGPAFLEKPKPWLDAGASGTYVRSLVELARRWQSGER